MWGEHGPGRGTSGTTSAGETKGASQLRDGKSPFKSSLLTGQRFTKQMSLKMDSTPTPINPEVTCCLLNISFCSALLISEKYFLKDRSLFYHSYLQTFLHGLFLAGNMKKWQQSKH
ncbi:unnamed protein product [Lepidochelys kempii]